MVCHLVESSATRASERPRARTRERGQDSAERMPEMSTGCGQTLDLNSSAAPAIAQARRRTRCCRCNKLRRPCSWVLFTSELSTSLINSINSCKQSCISKIQTKLDRPQLPLIGSRVTRRDDVTHMSGSCFKNARTVCWRKPVAIPDTGHQQPDPTKFRQGNRVIVSTRVGRI
jgi:hypothetical protein